MFTVWATMEEAILSPNDHMAWVGGPKNAMPFLCSRSGSFGFSEAWPHPAHTAWKGGSGGRVSHVCHMTHLDICCYCVNYITQDDWMWKQLNCSINDSSTMSTCALLSQLSKFVCWEDSSSVSDETLLRIVMQVAPAAERGGFSPPNCWKGGLSPPHASTNLTY